MPFCIAGAGMNWLTVCLTILLTQPAPILAETVLDWIEGDWGLELTHAGNCMENPIRIAVTDNRQQIRVSFPLHAERYPDVKERIWAGPVLSARGLTVIFQNKLSSQPYFITMSEDRSALGFGPFDGIESQLTGMGHTRC
jgi:hypothetical protein